MDYYTYFYSFSVEKELERFEWNDIACNELALDGSVPYKFTRLTFISRSKPVSFCNIQIANEFLTNDR